MTQKQYNPYGWVVTFSGTAINLALGALYAYSVFKIPIENEFGLTATQSALPYSICIAVFAVFMVLAGRWQDKIGPRFVTMIGGVLVGLGFLLSGRATESNALFLLVMGFGVLAGAGIGMGYASATPAAIKWFPARMKGLIVGIVVSGFGLASVYVAPLSASILKSSDSISYTFTILGIGFMAALILFSQILKNPPAGYNPNAGPAPTAGGAPPPPALARDYSTREMLGTYQFYLLWFMFAFGSGAGLMIISFIAGEARLTLGFWAVAILAVGNAGGRIITGAVSDKLGRKLSFFIIFVLQAGILAAFGLGQMTSTVALTAVGAVVAGYTYGSYLALFPSAMADYYGLKNLGLNYGTVFTAWGFGGLALPIVAGMIKDATGTYAAAYYIAAALCALAALLSLALKTPEYKETDAVRS